MNKPLLLCAIGLAGLLVLKGVDSAPLDSARHCERPIGPESTLVRDSWLCQSSHTGHRGVFSCREYETNGTRYRAYFRGGTTPKAVARIEQGTAGEYLEWLEYPNGSGPLCETKPPTAIPKTSHHIGSGVCEGSAGQPLPCSIFEDHPPGQTTIVHYMVFYDKDGKGPQIIEPITIGLNFGAMAAELAYQIGTELANTACCPTKALDYLAYALEEYPDYDTYRNEYEWQRLDIESLNDQDPCAGTGLVN